VATRRGHRLHASPKTIIPTSCSPGSWSSHGLRQRSLVVPLEFRYGLTPRIQLFTRMPVGVDEHGGFLYGFRQLENDGGIGDTSAGASILLHKGGEMPL